MDYFSKRNSFVWTSFLLRAVLEKQERVVGQHCELRVYIKFS
jgi:hypothetical protein